MAVLLQRILVFGLSVPGIMGTAVLQGAAVCSRSPIADHHFPVQQRESGDLLPPPEFPGAGGRRAPGVPPLSRGGLRAAEV